MKAMIAAVAFVLVAVTIPIAASAYSIPQPYGGYGYQGSGAYSQPLYFPVNNIQFPNYAPMAQPASYQVPGYPVYGSQKYGAPKYNIAAVVPVNSYNQYQSYQPAQYSQPYYPNYSYEYYDEFYDYGYDDHTWYMGDCLDHWYH